MNIRRASVTDITWLLEQLRAFDRFFGGKHSLFPSKDEVAIEIVGKLVETQPFFIAERSERESDAPDDERMGFIAGALGPHPYNPELVVLAELFWWVDPAYRGSTVGARLFETFVQYGREYADWIQMTLEANSPIDPATLERRGFVPHERTFLLEVER